MQNMTINKTGLTLDGRDFYLASGDMHYFRVHPSEWRRRLEMMRDFGLTAVQTYCPWNLHEPTEGQYDFSGMLDLSRFLETAQSVGFKVLLRPSPYMCGEWDFGGLPWWLLSPSAADGTDSIDVRAARSKPPYSRDAARAMLRCSAPEFLARVGRYYERLAREFAPYLSSRGGPIIAVCIENEYGSFGTDLDYLNFLVKTLRDLGVDLPLYQTDCTSDGLEFTKPLGTWLAVNYRIDSEHFINELRRIQPDLVPFVGEYWSGRAVYWGEDGSPRDVAPIAAAYRRALDMGAFVNFYMFAGGTNFGFMNGARITKSFDGTQPARFRAITTSYDADALISEDGRATEKYYACRRELDEYLGREVRTSRLPDPEFQTLDAVELSEAAYLFDNLDLLAPDPVRAAEPLTFEELGQGYGYVLYRVELPVGPARELLLSVGDIRDLAAVYIDGQPRALWQRGLESEPLRCNAGTAHRLDLLVENMGRINTRPEFGESKGILGEVRYGTPRVYGFLHYKLDHNRASELRYSAERHKGMPVFLRGHFAAREGISSHLDMTGFKSGYVMINGFNLGRYRDCGPQRELYIPGGILKAQNELIIFELADSLNREWRPVLHENKP